MAQDGICVCTHPENWHEGKTCYGSFCDCQKYQSTFFKYDSRKWEELNDIKMVKDQRGKSRKAEKNLKAV